MKRVMMLVAVVGGMVQMAVGADTHDYSTYIRLASKSLAVTQGWPAADQWDPAGEMSESGYYIVPSGYSLTSKPSKDTGAGGTWPCAELAFSYLRVTTSYSRDYVAVIPHAAILSGGTLAMGSAYGTLKGETLDIRGSAENPSVITYDYRSENNKPNYYALITSALTCSDPEAVVKFKRTAVSDGYDLQRAFRVTGGFSDFLGTVVVDGAVTWLRDTGAANFDIAGAIELANGGNLYIEAKNPTFGSLTVGDGSTLQLAKAKTVTVNGAVSIAEGAVVVVDDIANHASVWDGSAAPVVKFLSVCGADNAAAVDREALLAAVVRGCKVFTGTTADGTPKLTLAETMRADGGVDFAVSHETVSSLTLKNGERFVVTKPLSFASLTMEAGATLEIAEGQTLTLTGPFTFAEGATIIVDGLVSTPFVYDNGSNKPAQVPFLSFAQASDAEAVDHAALLAAVIRSGKVFSGTHASGVPRLCIVRDGGDFAVSHDLIVKQSKNCAANTGPYGYEMYEGYLSDGQAISPLKDYYSASNIYFDSPYVFPGRSLTIAGLIGFYSGNVFKTDDLYVLSGSWFRQMSTNPTGYLRGKAQLIGKLECRVHGPYAMFLESNLSGSGDLLVVFDAAKAVEKKETAARGCVELSGTNTAWTGRALVGCGRAEAEGSVGLTNLTLRISDSRNLGGGLDAPVFDSLKVADTCTFAVTDSTTFEAANRGWCLMDGSTVSISADKTVTANETVTFGGTVTKAGAGTLVLGGPSKAYDAENDAPVDTPNGAELVVAAGGLGATATDAFAGLSSLTFCAGTKYVASAANAFGADLSAVALTVPAGGVPIAFTDIPKDGAAITVATFATAEDAAKFTFEKPRGYIVMRSVEEVGGKFVLKAGIEKSGALLIVR